jgi:phosphate acetyltransferase
MLIGKTAKVGYFRPIIEDFEDGKLDNHIETVISFGLDIAFEDAFIT